MICSVSLSEVNQLTLKPEEGEHVRKREKERRGRSGQLGKVTDGSDLNLYLTAVIVRLQPNADTRQKQLAAWCSLALSYCRHRKLYTVDVLEVQESPMFNNKKIESIL